MGTGNLTMGDGTSNSYNNLNGIGGGTFINQQLVQGTGVIQNLTSFTNSGTIKSGDDDGIVPKSAAGVYAKSLPHATLSVIKDCGHFVELEKPVELAQLVTSFLGS